MDEKQKEILAYLTRVKWAPMSLLEKQFNLSTSELSVSLAEILDEVEIRVDRDIAHITVL